LTTTRAVANFVIALFAANGMDWCPRVKEKATVPPRRGTVAEEI